MPTADRDYAVTIAAETPLIVFEQVWVEFTTLIIVIFEVLL